MMSIKLNPLDRVEILTLQDNYIDIASGDGSNIIQRAVPLKDGEIKNTILAEHGFSALITVSAGDRKKTFLFDFGLSEFGATFNAEALNADLKAVGAMVLSHGHIDHTGGFCQLAQKVGKKGIPFVVHPAAFRRPRYLKITEKFKVYFPTFVRETVQEAGLDLVESVDPYPLLDGDLLFLGEIPPETAFEKGMPNAYYEQDGEERLDAIEDDTAVVMNLKDKGLVVLSGCAHSGIINSVNHARAVTGVDSIHAVMGGFHLTGKHFEPFIKPTADALKAFEPAYVIPTHCTGRNAINYIEQEMPEQFLLNMAGTKLTFTSNS
jgi:7,8-dihydropterin-6-yl-methyl-4-(beta-D-ribofuranosyl)aminobenzene 5'-phosphate synthase